MRSFSKVQMGVGAVALAATAALAVPWYAGLTLRAELRSLEAELLSEPSRAPRRLAERSLLDAAAGDYVSNLKAAHAENLQQAYDRVPRRRLWEKLAAHGVDPDWLAAVQALCFWGFYIRSDHARGGRWQRPHRWLGKIAGK
mgnify:CR=1 FL=1